MYNNIKFYLPKQRGGMNLNISIYAYDWERSSLCSMVEDQCIKSNRRPVVHYYEDYDSFIRELPRQRCDMVIVARNGADGMEGAFAVRDLLPRVPLVWFSDDNGFGPQSYRVGCEYFAPRPITDEQMHRALSRCGI